MSPVITVENLSKKYIIGHQKQERYTALRDVLANGARQVAHKLAHPFAAPENDPTHEEFWALKDVSFDIQQGDRVGITGHYGAGFSAANLKNFRQFYQTYSDRAASISHPSGSQLAASDGLNPISYPAGSESPSGIHPNLSWSHYRTLMRVENNAARQFCETEAVQSNWSRRDLERQIGSLFYECLLASADKTAMLESARHEAIPVNPLDMLKDPYVLEFLDLPNVPQLQENQFEQANIDKLQHLLLELGRGFSFVAWQKRMSASIGLKCSQLKMQMVDGKMHHGEMSVE